MGRGDARERAQLSPWGGSGAERNFAATIWNALAGVSFFLLLGIAGGVEHDSIALGTGMWMMAASMGAWALFSWLAGWFL